MKKYIYNTVNYFSSEYSKYTGILLMMLSLIEKDIYWLTVGIGFITISIADKLSLILNSKTPN